MREVQRHNFEFIRTEILDLSIEEFADKIGVSKSSYQRMKSQSYDAEYYFSPIQKACELAKVSLDIFSTQYLTKEIYNKRRKKTQGIVSSKKQLLALLLLSIVMLSILSAVVTRQTIYAREKTHPHISSEKQISSEINHVSEDIYYWTDKDGGSYHANRNCTIIKSRNNIESGSLKDAQKKKKFDSCDFCVIQ